MYRREALLPPRLLLRRPIGSSSAAALVTSNSDLRAMSAAPTSAASGSSAACAQDGPAHFGGPNLRSKHLQRPDMSDDGGSGYSAKAQETCCFGIWRCSCAHSDILWHCLQTPARRWSGSSGSADYDYSRSCLCTRCHQHPQSAVTFTVSVGQSVVLSLPAKSTNASCLAVHPHAASASDIKILTSRLFWKSHATAWCCCAASPPPSNFTVQV